MSELLPFDYKIYFPELDENTINLLWDVDTIYIDELAKWMNVDELSIMLLINKLNIEISIDDEISVDDIPELISDIKLLHKFNAVDKLYKRVQEHQYDILAYKCALLPSFIRVLLPYGNLIHETDHKLVKRILNKKIISEGYIYCITTNTDSKKSIYKIGKTRSLGRRLKQLNGMSSQNFRIEQKILVKNPDILEHLIHRILTNYRLDGKEFFQVDLNIIKNIFALAKQQDMQWNTLELLELEF
jgi:hypothetical protein